MDGATELKDSPMIVRPAVFPDAEEMARVHTEWAIAAYGRNDEPRVACMRGVKFSLAKAFSRSSPPTTEGSSAA
jgi:hypothetical protein